jgi:hypothetical protein
VTAEQCRDLAAQYKAMGRAPGVSRDRAFILKNIARTFAGAATQLDMLAAKTKEESLGRPARVTGLAAFMRRYER